MNSEGFQPGLVESEARAGGGGGAWIMLASWLGKHVIGKRSRGAPAQAWQEGMQNALAGRARVCARHS